MISGGLQVGSRCADYDDTAGLLVSTVLTLVVIPVVYFAAMRNLEKITEAV